MLFLLIVDHIRGVEMISMFHRSSQATPYSFLGGAGFCEVRELAPVEQKEHTSNYCTATVKSRRQNQIVQRMTNYQLSDSKVSYIVTQLNVTEFGQKVLHCAHNGNMTWNNEQNFV